MAKEADFYVQLCVFGLFLVFTASSIAPDTANSHTRSHARGDSGHRPEIMQMAPSGLLHCILCVVVCLMCADIVLQGFALQQTMYAKPIVQFLMDGKCLDRSESGIHLDRDNLLTRQYEFEYGSRMDPDRSSSSWVGLLRGLFSQIAQGETKEILSSLDHC